jgi:hypothetical protein
MQAEFVLPKPGTVRAIGDAGARLGKPIELDDPLARPASPGQEIGFPYSVVRPALRRPGQSTSRNREAEALL